MRLTDAELVHLIAAILSLLLASQIFGGLFQRLQQPRVVGEILGGVLLGPMVLGATMPWLYTYLFKPEPAGQKVLAFVIWLGLLLLMFASGLDSHDFQRGGEWKTISLMTFLGILVPMIAAFGATYAFDLSRFYGPDATATSFGMILAMATAISAIPVIAKIFLDLDMVATPFARVVLAVAFVEDVLLWILLSLTLGLGRSAHLGPLDHAWTVVATIGFFGLCMGLGHRLYDRLAASRFWPLASAHPACGPVVVLLVVSLTCYALGVNSIFGGFLAGRIVANAQTVDESTRAQLRGLAFGLFIPVFFAGVGLRFDLRVGFDTIGFLAFLFGSVGVKILSTLVAGRMAGKALLPSLHLSIALNARGAVGIVLATIAYDARLISASFYAILILVALLTSQFAGWWLARVKRDHPEQLALDPPHVPAPAAAGI